MRGDTSGDSKKLKCEGDQNGKTVELKVGTEQNQHIVSIKPGDDGKGSDFGLVYIQMRKAAKTPFEEIVRLKIADCQIGQRLTESSAIHRSANLEI